MLANFAHALAELRACLSELRRDNSDLCSQLLCGGSGEERERKQPRSLASSTLDLAPLSRPPSGHAGLGVGAIDDSRRFSQNGDSDRQCRSKFTFEPIQSSVWVMKQARYGLRGDRVGEASSPGLGGEEESVVPTMVASDDVTQRDAPTEETCSDTESCRSQDAASVRPSGRRLRLVLDEDRLPPQRWRPEARVVEGLFRTLGGRVGAVPSGSPIPRVLMRQRWSPVNVPLVWV